MSSVVFLLESSAVDDQSNLVGEELRDHIAYTDQRSRPEACCRIDDDCYDKNSNASNDIIGYRRLVEAQVTFEGAIPEFHHRTPLSFMDYKSR